MKEYFQSVKIFSLVLFFILIILLSGCTSTRVITSSELTYVNAKEYHFVVHSSRREYQLEKSAKISNDTLSGKIVQVLTDNHSYIGDRIDLYLTADSMIRFEKGEFLSVPIDAVKRATIEEMKSGGRFGIVTFSIFAMIGFMMLAGIWMFNL